MGRRHLDGAGAELAIHSLVSHDGNQPPDDRQAHHLPHQIAVTRIIGMHRHGRIAQNRLRPRRSHSDRAVARLGPVAHVPEVRIALLVVHLQIRDGRAAARAPVHQIGAAINEPLIVEAHERLAHGARKPLVHGKALAFPVTRHAQPTMLLRDALVVDVLPLPHPLHKLFAAQIVARETLFGDLALHHVLRSDAGMVAARHPQCRPPRHAAVANHGVFEPGHNGMAQVQGARHVGRRH